MNFENGNIWCWLIPALVGIICGIIGYYWGKGSSTKPDNTADLKMLKDRNAKLQADLEACLNKTSKVSVAPVASVATDIASTSEVFDALAARTALGKAVKQDDLKIVEGIGPKIAGMFKEHGIATWKALSEVSVARCQEILDSGGNRYKVHDPASWPMQAKMCYEGKWADLAKWQDEHKHGKL
jgi:predicted flap endonuclease-1-like 5' DNA nuclease